MKKPKAIKRIGKRGLAYIGWRDNTAIPYLDDTFGHLCSVCGVGGKLDVAHIRKRGSHPKLKMDLTNIIYKCRSCHLVEHNAKDY